MRRRQYAAQAPHRLSRLSVGFTEAGTSSYLERAMILWPRLDRTRLRRAANDPVRIAAIVVRRTSQPFDVVLAMLTHQTVALSGSEQVELNSPSAEAAPVRLHIVGLDESAAMEGRRPAAGSTSHEKRPERRAATR
jgi:hypothetical protein